MSGLVFRKIVPEDNNALAAVIRAGMTEFGLNRSGSGFNDPQLDDLCAAYAAPGSAFFVALEDDVVLGGGGFAPLSGSDGKTCELQRMYLSPAARGKGAGKQLLGMCLEEARTAGYHACYLETEQNMTAARGLYARFGFRQQAHRTGNTGHCACNTFYIKSLTD